VTTFREGERVSHTFDINTDIVYGHVVQHQEEQQLTQVKWADGSGPAWHRSDSLRSLEEEGTLDRDAVARVLCRIEGRSTGRPLDEVLAPGIELWMRHRYEAERLIEELQPLLSQMRNEILDHAGDVASGFGIMGGGGSDPYWEGHNDAAEKISAALRSAKEQTR
jgi:hypothetical protein